MPDKDLPEEKQEEEKNFKDIVGARIRTLWEQQKNWRLALPIMEIIPKVQTYFPIVTFNNFYLTKFLDLLKDGNNEVRKVAIKGLCKLLAYNKFAHKRKEVLTKILSFATSSCFYERKQFLIFCNFAIQELAPSLITEIKLFDRYFLLAADNVSNIRFSFIKYAIKIWTYSDDDNRKKIMSILNRMIEDKNKDVKIVAEKVYNFLVEHSDEIAKSDALRRQNNDEDCKMPGGALERLLSEWK